MSDELFIRCCAPTLAAIKTGSLFSCSFEAEAELMDRLRQVNRTIREKRVCAIPLRRKNNRALIYVYRPQMLEKDLKNPLAADILCACGYAGLTPARCIVTLMERLRQYRDFPHEIGLFLGYPPADVRGFMERKACKCTGLWKVYESDETEARKVFRRCKNCTQAYLKRSQEGWSLSRLTLQPRQFS